MSESHGVVALAWSTDGNDRTPEELRLDRMRLAEAIRCVSHTFTADSNALLSRSHWEALAAADRAMTESGLRLR